MNADKTKTEQSEAGKPGRELGFEREYSEARFWDKVVHYARAAGRDVMEKALQLYYAAQDPATPGWARSVIYASLGYFIFPVDAIADLTPAVGYADDLGVLAMALATVAVHISADVKQKARQKLADWFGE